MTLKVAKRRLSGFDFSGDSAHVALVGPSVGGPANGIETLVFKSTKDITETHVSKAVKVQVEMDFEDFLVKFFSMYYDDAEVLAKVLGYADDETADTPTLNSYQDYIDQRAAGIKIMKSLQDSEDALEALSLVTADDFVKVLEAQSLLEKAVLTIEKAKKKEGSETLSASAYAYVPDATKPSTWKLRIDDATHTSAAVAALGKGYRGNKVQIPAADLPSVKRKVKAAYKKFFPENDVPEILKSTQEVITLETEIEKAVAKAVAAQAAAQAAEMEILKGALASKESELAAYVLKEKENVMKARKEALSAVLAADTVEPVLKSLETLNDEAFAVVLKGFQATDVIQKNAGLFKETGVSGEGSSKAQSELELVGQKIQKAKEAKAAKNAK